jgi:hypothetical protein
LLGFAALYPSYALLTFSDDSTIYRGAFFA